MSDFFSLVRLIFRLQSKQDKFKFILILILLVLVSYLDFKIITMVGPLVSMASDRVGDVATGAISLVFMSWLSALLRVTQIKIGHGYIYRLGHRLSTLTLRNALYADYVELKGVHTASLLKRIEMINIMVNSVLTPLLLLMASGLTAIAIGVGLIYTDVQFAIAAIVSLAAFYILSALIFRKALLKNAVLFNDAQGERIFLIREAISGFRELKVGGLIGDYQKRFELVDDKFRKSQVKNLVLGASPRFILEGIVYTALALIVYWASLQDSGKGVAIISTLATFALGAQRLLPHAQTIYSSTSSIIGHHSMIAELCSPLFTDRSLLTKFNNENKATGFEVTGSISIRNLQFSYPKSIDPILKDINLEITLGSRTALVGSSGSGKTTFLELIAGLLIPTKGSINIGGKRLSENNIDLWQRHVAYVPQNPFLMSGSLRDNILLGGNKIITDEEIKKTLSSVGLHDWIKTIKNDLDYDVGENGSNLSGGQRQRIAIARAIAGGKKIFIFDEITSNLDATNESSILDLIISMPRNCTIFCSLHKANILDKFDRVLTFSHNGAVNDKLNMKL